MVRDRYENSLALRKPIVAINLSSKSTPKSLCLRSNAFRSPLLARRCSARTDEPLSKESALPHRSLRSRSGVVDFSTFARNAGGNRRCRQHAQGRRRHHANIGNGASEQSHGEDRQQPKPQPLLKTLNLRRLAAGRSDDLLHDEAENEATADHAGAAQDRDHPIRNPNRTETDAQAAAVDKCAPADLSP